MTYPISLSSPNLFEQSKILVWQKPLAAVPDTPDDFSRVSQFLKSLGGKVTTLATERQVAMAIRSQVPDLLIIHLRTASIGGQMLCNYLRQQVNTQYLPIVFVGVRSTKQECIKAMRCGANSYFQMPVELEEFGLHVFQHLRFSQRMQQLQCDQASLIQKVGEFNQTLRQQEALKVSLAKENQTLQRIAFIDGLTQVANRRSFNQTVLRLWQQAWQQQQPLSLLLCDIDYFKRYNDTYGHLAGDECLRSVAAALLRGAHRYQDYVARYGGEEFAVLLPETDLLGAQQVARAIQSEVAKAQIPHRGSLVKPFVSISMGVCSLVPNDVNQPCEALIQRTDDALYGAKLQGRDRTVVYSAEGCSIHGDGAGGTMLRQPIESLTAEPKFSVAHSQTSESKPA